MGLFDFAANIASAVVKVAITPIAVVKDVVDVAIGEKADNTKKLIKSAGKDLDQAVDEV